MFFPCHLYSFSSCHHQHHHRSFDLTYSTFLPCTMPFLSLMSLCSTFSFEFSATFFYRLKIRFPLASISVLPLGTHFICLAFKSASFKHQMFARSFFSSVFICVFNGTQEARLQIKHAWVLVQGNQMFTDRNIFAGCLQICR